MKKFFRRFIKWLISIGLVILLCLGVLHFIIENGTENTATRDADYLIVLGARLHGETMSLSLLYRMETALAYLRENPTTKVIVSGGQGEGETITEAEAMSRYLLKHGIEKERIVRENRSTSTYENLKFSQALLETGEKHLIIVSNDFHLFRAGLIARRLGLHPEFLPAPTPDVVKVKMWTREYAAVVKSLLFDR